MLKLFIANRVIALTKAIGQLRYDETLDLVYIYVNVLTTRLG